MTGRFRLPVFTDETLSSIIFGMENQDVDYMLNLDDGTLYSPEMGEEIPENLVELPPWGSSDGYQLMVSFANSCKDRNLKEKLAKELSSKSHGVFRRFRDVLSQNPDDLKTWYDFKDSRMRAHIKSWYRDKLGKQRDELESDDIYEGELLSEFDVIHLDELDSYCEKLLDDAVIGNPIRRKVLGAFCSKKAFVIYKGEKPCGALVYEVVENTACILLYTIEETFRGQGLFCLLFDLFNREMERHQIESVAMAFGPQSAFLRGMFSDHETAFREGEGYATYSVHDWNSATLSSETAYVL